MRAARPTLICPRCGYDQSGVVSSWTDSCPVEGICSECGHGFRWFDIYNPDHERLRGFVEHARGVRQTLLWAWSTFLLALLPNRFWRKVRIDHRIRQRRMFLWPLIIAALFYLVNAALAATLIFIGSQIYASQAKAALLAPPGWDEYLTSLTYPVAEAATGRLRFLVPTLLSASGSILPIVAFHLSFFATMIFFPDTRRFAKIRAGHVLRGLVYGLLFLLMLGVLRTGWLLTNAALGRLPHPALTWGGPASGPWTWDFSGAFPIRYAALIGPAARLWMFAGFAWLTWWWWTAVLRGWSVRRGYFVCGLLTFVAVLAAGTIYIFLGVTPPFDRYVRLEQWYTWLW